MIVVSKFISVKLLTWFVEGFLSSQFILIVPLQPGPDAFNVVPNSKPIVARQAFKNNMSRYTINGKTSNFTGVQTLLKGRGINLDHKWFLILQVNTTPVVCAANYLTHYNPGQSRIYCSDETESAHRAHLNTSRTSLEHRNTKSLLRRQWSRWSSCRRIVGTN